MTNTLKVTHRSYSAVRKLRTCGQQYKLEKIDKVPSRPGAAMAGGTSVHVGTEFVDQAIHNGLVDHEGRDTILAEALRLTLEALDVDVAEREEKSGFPVGQWLKYGKQDVEWYRTTGIPNSITSYLDWRLANPEFVLAEVPDFGPAIEVPFWYVIEGQAIQGWIDRIFVYDGHYCPLDIKSGKKPETDEQLGLYAAALNEVLDWNVEWGYYLYNLKNGEAKLTKPMRCGHWSKDKLSQVYLPATKQIDQQIFLPNPGEACFHCGVNYACPFAQAVL